MLQVAVQSGNADTFEAALEDTLTWRKLDRVVFLQIAISIFNLTMSSFDKHDLTFKLHKTILKETERQSWPPPYEEDKFASMFVSIAFQLF